MLSLAHRSRAVAAAWILIASASAACSQPDDPASIPCGSLGQECCSPARNQQPCGVGMTCIAGTCNRCGGGGQPCCPGVNPCTDPTDSCGADGLCEGCNDPGQPCCEGQACGDGGFCTRGVCNVCGHAGQTCCDGVCPFAVECNSRGVCDNAIPDAGPHDAGLFPTATCTRTSDCSDLGSRAVCLTAYPGGLCTTTCTTDRDCGIAGHCVQGQCLPACTSGEQQCDPFGGMCAAVNAGEQPSVCVPSCFPTGATAPSPGFPSCPASMACDAYSSTCSGMTSSGAPDGAPCTADGDCAGGRCITEIDPTTGMPTGFVGGYCISFGYRLDGSFYQLDMPVPQGNCPTGAAPVPFADTMVGDSTACFATCAYDSDCRSGYTCSMLGDGMGHTSTGYCFPIDCNTPGMSCPFGFTCMTLPDDAATPPGVCAPSADGGTAMDAAVDSGIDG